jgi:hypothetical protein
MYHMRVVSNRDPRCPVQVNRASRSTAPDFFAMLREIHGNKVLKVSGATLVAEQRGKY